MVIVSRLDANPIQVTDAAGGGELAGFDTVSITIRKIHLASFLKSVC